MKDKCCHCSSPVGESAKVQPTDCDGETWCPPCFVGVRMHQEPDRFNATMTGVAQCTRCGWKSVTFGSRNPGGALMCGHCTGFYGKRVPLEQLHIPARQQKEMREMIGDTMGRRLGV